MFRAVGFCNLPTGASGGVGECIQIPLSLSHTPVSTSKFRGCFHGVDLSNLRCNLGVQKVAQSEWLLPFKADVQTSECLARKTGAS